MNLKFATIITKQCLTRRSTKFPYKSDRYRTVIYAHRHKYTVTNMNPKFQFSPSEVSTFTGFGFYHTYKQANFLQHQDNVIMILSRGYQLRDRLREVQPGGSLVVDGMTVWNRQPLLIKKASPKVKLENHEFTFNRLTGLVAAYAFEHRTLYPDLHISEASALGLSWDNTDKSSCRLYLAAVSGTEHFYEQFTYLPLLCALRKLRLNKIKPEFVTKYANVKNDAGERMIQLLQKNPGETARMWKLFPGSTRKDFERILKTIDK